MRRAIGIFYPRVALYLILKISNVYSFFILIPSSAALNTACGEATWRMPLRELAAVRRQRRRTEQIFLFQKNVISLFLRTILSNKLFTPSIPLRGYINYAQNYWGEIPRIVRCGICKKRKELFAAAHFFIYMRTTLSVRVTTQTGRKAELSRRFPPSNTPICFHSHPPD